MAVAACDETLASKPKLNRVPQSRPLLGSGVCHSIEATPKIVVSIVRLEVIFEKLWDVLQVAVAEPQRHTLATPHGFSEGFLEHLVVGIPTRIEPKLGGLTQPRHSIGDHMTDLPTIGKVVLRQDDEIRE